MTLKQPITSRARIAIITRITRIAGAKIAQVIQSPAIAKNQK